MSLCIVRKSLIQKLIFGSLWTSLAVRPVSHSFFRRKFVGSSKLHIEVKVSMSLFVVRKSLIRKLIFGSLWTSLTVHPVFLSFFRRKFVGSM